MPATMRIKRMSVLDARKSKVLKRTRMINNIKYEKVFRYNKD